MDHNRGNILTYVRRSIQLRRPASATLVSLFILIAGFVYVHQGDTGTVAEGKEVIRETFGKGELQNRLVYTFAGWDTGVNLSLPTGSTVLDASLEVRGELYVKNMPEGWTGDTFQFPPVSAPSTFTSNLYSGHNYTSTTSSDDAGQKTWINASAPYTHLAFNLTSLKANITAINISWEGQGYLSGGFVNPYRAMVYVWNISSSAWEKFGEYTSENPGDQEFYVRFSSWAEGLNYVDDSTRIHIIAFGPQGVSTKSWISTDRARMVVDLFPSGQDVYPDPSFSSYPANPAIDIGDDGSDDWSFSGAFAGVQTVGGSQGLAGILQEYIDAGGDDPGHVDVVINTTSSSAGVLRLSDLNICLRLREVNLKPYIITPFPPGLGFAEDTGGGYKLLDLNLYFGDDVDTGNLRFGVAHQENSSVLEAVIDEGHYLTVNQHLPDWNGAMQFMLRVSDNGLDGIPENSDDKSLLTPLFNITVTPVQDPPRITKVKGERVYDSRVNLSGQDGGVEGQWFNGSVKVEEVDGDDLHYRVNLTREDFSIDNGTGRFSFMPTNWDVGSFSFKLTVRDTNVTGGGSDTVRVDVEVGNTNDPPVILSVAGLDIKDGKVRIPEGEGAVQDEPFHFDVIVDDPDLGVPAGEELTFGSNVTDGKGTDEMPNLSVNTLTGNYTFTPTSRQAGVAFVWVEIFVVDHKGKTDSVDLYIPITPKNHPPPSSEILSPQQFHVYNTTTISFECSEVVDPDGDVLTYYWDFDTTDGTIDYVEGIAVKHTYADEGEYTARLTVSDGRGTSGTVVTFTIQLGQWTDGGDWIPPDDPGNDTAGGGGDDTDDNITDGGDGGGDLDDGDSGDGGGDSGDDSGGVAPVAGVPWWIVVILLLVIIALLGANLAKGRSPGSRKGKDGEDGDDDDDDEEEDGEDGAGGVPIPMGPGVVVTGSPRVVPVRGAVIGPAGPVSVNPRPYSSYSNWDSKFSMNGSPYGTARRDLKAGMVYQMSGAGPDAGPPALPKKAGDNGAGGKPGAPGESPKMEPSPKSAAGAKPPSGQPSRMEAAPKPKPDVAPSPKPEPKAEPAPEPEPKVEIAPKPEQKVGPAPKPEPRPEPAPKAEAGPAAAPVKKQASTATGRRPPSHVPSSPGAQLAAALIADRGKSKDKD